MESKKIRNLFITGGILLAFSFIMMLLEGIALIHAIIKQPNNSEFFDIGYPAIFYSKLPFLLAALILLLLAIINLKRKTTETNKKYMKLNVVLYIVNIVLLFATLFYFFTTAIAAWGDVNLNQLFWTIGEIILGFFLILPFIILGITINKQTQNKKSLLVIPTLAVNILAIVGYFVCLIIYNISEGNTEVQYITLLVISGVFFSSIIMNFTFIIELIIKIDTIIQTFSIQDKAEGI